MRPLLFKSLISKSTVPLIGCVLAFAAVLPVAAKDKNKKKDPDAIGDRNVSGKVNWYSLEKEIALGKQLAQEVERQSRVINDPVIAEYVNRVGQNLVRNSDAKVPFTIKVIDGDEVNAFALPGGFFFVNSGLILKADTEAELAGVMAHEIAHVAARHGTRQATRGEIANIATIPLDFSGRLGRLRHPARRRAADSDGVPAILRGLGIRSRLPRPAIHVQDRLRSGSVRRLFREDRNLEKRKPGTMAKVFSTHPPTGDRITKAQNEISDILKAKPEYVVTTSEFNDVKGRLAMLENRRKLDRCLRRRSEQTNSAAKSELDRANRRRNRQFEEGKGDSEDSPKLKRRPDGGGGRFSPTQLSKFQFELQPTGREQSRPF